MSAQSAATEDDRLGLRLQEGEKAELKALAEVRGTTLTDLVRPKIEELLAEARRAREIFARQTA